MLYSIEGPNNSTEEGIDFMSNESQPKITIVSFSESKVHEYIEKIEKIDNAYPLSQPLLVEIDSFGGSVYGLSILYNKLTTLGRPIITYTPSKAMSAGAILLAAAGTPGFRFAAPTADILVHEIQAGARGDIKDIEDQMKNLKEINNRWMDILAKSMGLNKAADIRRLIKENAIGSDVNLTAKKSKKLGIIDEIGVVAMHPQFYWEVVKK